MNHVESLVLFAYLVAALIGLYVGWIVFYRVLVRNLFSGEKRKRNGKPD